MRWRPVSGQAVAWYTSPRGSTPPARLNRLALEFNFLCNLWVRPSGWGVLVLDDSVQRPSPGHRDVVGALGINHAPVVAEVGRILAEKKRRPAFHMQVHIGLQCVDMGRYYRTSLQAYMLILSDSTDVRLRDHGDSFPALIMSG